MQTVFQRFELKYLITSEQKILLEKEMMRHMALDQYGRTVIRNLYLDTDSFRLIRHSIEKPVYKEKLRLRSYQQADARDNIFVELKKKYQGIVYKRRLSMPQMAALQWLNGDKRQMPDSQIGREIQYFSEFYGKLQPAVYLSYCREAWYSLDGSDFRVTFDDEILCRREDLSLSQPPDGTSILPIGTILMEIKTGRGIPLWMTQLLTREQIFRTSFSKYGSAYQNLIYPAELQKGAFYYDRTAISRYL